ncbi:MAG: GTP-binding protein [Chitinophagaceae bacterium]
MKIHLLSGFLGSGKTTAIHQAYTALKAQGIKTGVITNDQGVKLVDGDFFASLGIPGREVINGCFCCNYANLDAGIASLIETNETEIIFAESVGSCTDIVATVLKPLLKYRSADQVTVSSFADVRLLQMMLAEETAPFDETVRYIYLKQLEEAGIIVINKVDLIDKAQLQAVKQIMQKNYSSKILLYQNSLDNESIQQWLLAINHYQYGPSLASLHIDYDVYAAGEAKLGWVDQSLEIFSPANNAVQLSEQLINKIYATVQARQYPIGHIKFLVNKSVKISFTAAREPQAAIPYSPGVSAAVLINMRVQTPPGMLAKLIADAIHEIKVQSGAAIIITSLAAFQPGYPRPVYRM